MHNYIVIPIIFTAMTEDTLLDQVDIEIAHRLFLVMDEVRAIFGMVTSEFDLTKGQAMVLRWLEKPQAMRDIAEGLACDPSNITGLVDKLEARNLVKRVPDPEDRRVKNIVLSDDGRSVQAAIHEAMAECVRALTGLNDDERELFLKLLRRMT